MSEGEKENFKIILIGDSATGKTSVRNRYFGKGFKKSYLMTLGVDFSIKKMGNRILQVWDLSGNHSFSKIRDTYYYGTNGCMLLFDLTKRETFENLQGWVDELARHVGEENGKLIPIIIVGNKVDLIEGGNHFIKEEEIEEFSKGLRDRYGYEYPWFLTSAKDGTNVDQIFENLIKEITEENSV